MKSTKLFYFLCYIEWHCILFRLESQITGCDETDFFMILTTILLTTELGENLLPYLSMMNIHNCLKSFFAEIKD